MNIVLYVFSNNAIDVSTSMKTIIVLKIHAQVIHHLCSSLWYYYTSNIKLKLLQLVYGIW
jgi:hypothetical protein